MTLGKVLSASIRSAKEAAPYVWRSPRAALQVCWLSRLVRHKEQMLLEKRWIDVA
jgi:hypothetical protein